MKPARLKRERETLEAMLRIYCKRVHHTPGGLCQACEDLLSYAMRRLDQCPYGEVKPTCKKCTIHCYRPAMKARVKEVMRYAGPRMMWLHPVLAFWHFADGVRRGQSLD